MTEEQIKQNAEKYAELLTAGNKEHNRAIYIAAKEGYETGAHSMLEEIEELELSLEAAADVVKILSNPWVNASKQLPPEDKDNSGYSVKVIGMFADGHISDCFCSLEEDIWFIDIFTCDKPTYWMPIPELKKG